MSIKASRKMKLEDDNEDEERLSATNFVPIKKEDNKSKPLPIEYNDRGQRSYTKNGLQIPENLNYQERIFLSRVSTKQEMGHKIRREVSKIVRIKARDYSSEKLERKEFLYYYENWYGVDYRGIKIPPTTDHVEGVYQEIEMESVINERGEKTGYRRSGQHQVYYIPFSKEKVDEIIEGSVGTDKDTIKFLFTDGALGYEFPYEEFVSRPYEELVAMLIAPGGPKTILQKQQLEKYQQDQQQISTMLTSSTSTTNTKQTKQ
jgi:hypothetical protein